MKKKNLVIGIMAVLCVGLLYWGTSASPAAEGASSVGSAAEVEWDDAEASTDPADGSVETDPADGSQAQGDSADASGAGTDTSVEADADEETDQALWNAAEHVYSHRGASGYEVEHTFAAYDLAIELGSHYIEQDLVTSKDGTLYVSHDESAERIAGVDRLYADMTDDEIDQLRTANGEKIHTLREVFERYGDSVQYLIELKDGESQLEAFVSLVQEFQMEERVIVQYLSPELLVEIDEIFPNMKKLLLARKQEVLEAGLAYSCVDIICVKYTLLTQENCDKVHAANKEFSVYWTSDVSEDVPGAIEIGVDSYFTNYTDTAIAYELELRDATDEEMEEN